MTDIWTPGPPPAPPQPLPPGLPLANQWNQAAGCMPSGCSLSVVGNVILDCTEGASISYAANGNLVWSLALNDGSNPPNVALQQWAGNQVVAQPITVSGSDGSTTFDAPVYLAADPVYPLEAATKEYVDNNPGPAPANGNTYVQQYGAWTAVALVPEAPIDGAIYGRQAASWTSISASFLPLTGGTITGNLTVNQVLTVQGSNSLLLNGPAGGQRAILSASDNSYRWQMQLADYTAETGNNTGSNFSLSAIGDTGAILSTPLSINRASGAVTIAAATGTSPGAPTLILNKGTGAPQGNLIQGQRNGLNRWQLNVANFNAELGGNLGSNFSIDRFDDTGAQNGVSPLLISRQTGVATFGYGVTIGGVLSLANPASLSILGGNPGDVLGTVNGAGTLAWMTPGGGSGGGIGDAPLDGQTYGRQNGGWTTVVDGIGEAPIDGTMYARLSASWSRITSANIADWTTALAPYALAANVPLPSTTPPTMAGAGLVGTTTTYARADHQHPTDITRYAANNPNGFITAASAPVRSVAGRTGAVTLTHTDIGDWGTAVVANYVPFSGGTMDGYLTLFGDPTAAMHAATKQYVDAHGAIGDNRIINGDMRIDQRNNGALGTVGGYTVDRWEYYASQAGKGQWQRNASNAPGFPYCLAFGSTSAYAPLAADYFEWIQAIEADMVSDFQWGTASAQPVTLSFWASAAGVAFPATFSGSITNTAGTRSYPFTFSLPTAATMTRIVVAIPGDTAGTWVMSGNAGSMYVGFDLGSGSSKRGPANAWTNGSLTGATGAVSVVSSATGAFYLTGVKLEIGSVATPFNRQSLAKRLADCQRYYATSQFGVVGYAQAAGADAGGFGYLPVTMRAAPTLNYSMVGADVNVSAGNAPDTIGLDSFRFSFSATAAGTVQASRNLVASAEL